jgi:hypothetical protein
MADDRSLADVIRFADPSGEIGDADIAAITRKLKFTEVLDLITYVGRDDLDNARNILAKYDQRFTVAKEYSSVPTAAKTQSMFKSAKPIGTSGTQNKDEEESLDSYINDPTRQNDPNVKQIKSILQRMSR